MSYNHATTWECDCDLFFVKNVSFIKSKILLRSIKGMRVFSAEFFKKKKKTL